MRARGGNIDRCSYFEFEAGFRSATGCYRAADRAVRFFLPALPNRRNLTEAEKYFLCFVVRT